MHNLVLSPIDPDRLVADIADKVTANILASCNTSLINPPPRIVDGEALEKELGITRQTLARWRKTNRIPYIQVGAVIRYDLNKVIGALEKKKGGRS